MKIKYLPTGINNFHNSAAITLIVSGEKTEGHSGPVYKISKYQARRIANHFCGITDCRCPHGAAEQMDEAGDTYGIRVGYSEV